jgi:hypothetical protein
VLVLPFWTLITESKYNPLNIWYLYKERRHEAIDRAKEQAAESMQVDVPVAPATRALKKLVPSPAEKKSFTVCCLFLGAVADGIWLLGHRTTHKQWLALWRTRVV